VELKFELNNIFSMTFAQGLTWHGVTSSKWISCVVRLATTNWAMIYDLTLSIKSACAGTRIDTFLIDTSFVLGTFRTDNTFGSASGGTSYIVGQTRTNGLSVYFAALAVGAAGTGLARIGGLLFRTRYIKEIGQNRVKLQFWEILRGVGATLQYLKGSPV
jgi:hypothetical protein